MANSKDGMSGDAYTRICVNCEQETAFGTLYEEFEQEGWRLSDDGANDLCAACAYVQQVQRIHKEVDDVLAHNMKLQPLNMDELARAVDMTRKEAEDEDSAHAHGYAT